MKTCENCMYVGTISVPAPPANEGEPPGVTEVAVCRFNPPSAHLIGTPMGPQAITVWPQINPQTDFCGAIYNSEATQSV